MKRQRPYNYLRMGLLTATIVLMGLPSWAAEEQPNVAPARTATEAGTQKTTSTEEIIADLQRQGMIDERQAAQLLEKYRGKIVQDAAGAPISKEELLQDLNDVTNARLDALAEQVQALAQTPAPKTVPDWINRVKFSGEVRLRDQGDFYDENNALMLDPNDPSELMNTQDSRNRIRLRARLGVQTEITDQVQAVIQLSTGDTSQPSSSNNTMGTYFRKSAILLNQAYIMYRPLPELILWGGRLPNPWFSTTLVWDKELNFDGAALTFDTQLMRSLGGFVTLGAFPVQEVELSSHDKWLYAAQTGLRFTLKDAATAKIGAAYYYFTNITGKANDASNPDQYDWTAPPFLQKGNTLMDIDPTTDYQLALASDYHELDVTAQLDIAVFDPIHVILTGDYVKNLGFDRAEVADCTGNPDVKKEVTGYQYGLQVGYPIVDDFGKWRASLTYKHLEADAVVDAFTDATFHAGGTNCEGNIIGLDLGLAKNIVLGAQYMQSNEISGPQLSIDTLLVDITVKF